MQERSSNDPILVTTNEALETHCRSWMAVPVLALDTEFVRTRTFFAKLGLIQVADGARTALIDTVAIRDLDSFRQLLIERQGETVLHSCSEDFGIFAHRFGTLPQSVFDTQVAAALLGYGFSSGYQALVSAVLGVELAKGETRSDWLRRPLSPAQLHYAAADVQHLYELYQHLHDELEDRGRGAWAKQEFDPLLAIDRYSVPPAQAYRRLKGHGRLRGRCLSVLQGLCEWREHEAAQRNLARNFVVHDRVLLGIAQQLPTTELELLRMKEVDRRSARRYGRQLLRLVRAAPPAAAESPDRARSARRIPRYKEILRSMQDLVERRSREACIAPEILAQKRVLDSFLRSFLIEGRRSLPEELKGWRREVVGDALLELLSGE